MDWNNIITAIVTGAIGGLAGGLIVLLTEQLIIFAREKRKETQQKLISFPHNERIIDETIFDQLRHGSSIELMKGVLGTPNKFSRYDEPVFYTSSFDVEMEGENEKQPEGYEEGSGVKTHSYLYRFKNADVKITSKDNETIDSLTVLASGEDLKFGYLIFPWDESEDLRFGNVKVTQQMVEDCRAGYIRTRWDNSFALSLYIGSPTYDYVTYFGYTDYREGVEVDAEHPENFIGGTITGVCLSQNDTDVYYIYFSELR